jgi:hypothetical protein
VRWHGAGFRCYWRWKSRPRGGRPQIETELRALISRMGMENPLWGAPRIHGELLKLGFEVAQSSVAKYMVKRRGPPSQGWRTFLRNHALDIAAMDLFIVSTIGFDLLYALIDFDGLGDVLEVPKPQLLAGEREFFEQVIVRLARNANSARFGYTLKPCGDVHAFAVNIVIVDDDVAEVYADPKFDLLIETYPGVPLAHAALQFNGASYRVNHGCELDQHAVSGRLDDTASMFFDFRIDQCSPMLLQLSERAFLIHAHETAVAGHIRRQNSRKSPLYVLAAQDIPPALGNSHIAEL